ncbi:hypothetical protein BH11ACT6_BH11ACT6_01890 [soil metagenome]
MDSIPMTRVAVQYEDGDGHVHRTAADGVIAEGAPVRLCYLLDDPATVALLRS